MELQSDKRAQTENYSRARFAFNDLAVAGRLHHQEYRQACGNLYRSTIENTGT